MLIIIKTSLQKVSMRKSLTLLLCFCLLSAGLSGCTSTQDTTVDSTDSTAEYAEKIFGQDIISVEILADDAEWQSMLEHATDEEYIKVDVVVNGTTFKDVGIRPKGNSSLSRVASSDSDRYSFRLKFDKYVDDQTCFGLDTFVLNNIITDATYMKEYVSYDIMKTAGVDCPLFGYSDVSVNGEPWGFYLAIELYNDSYDQRVHARDDGMFYNVKMIKNNHQDKANNTPAKPENIDQKNNTERPNDTDKKGGLGSNIADQGRSLKYIDDDSSSYASIFENAVGKSDESDYQKVISALKTLSEGEDLESAFDVDAILRYLAAHTIVVNLDSYSGSSCQNYYLYESDGKLTVLPWDYNESWGNFHGNGGNASVINFPIDTPLSGVEMEDRPLLEKLFANTEYLEKYHQYLQEILDNYFNNGQFEAKIESIDALINTYVKNDPSSFVTYEQYEKAIESFKLLGTLRAESVQGQLDGTIPSTTSAQNENSESLIVSDDLNLSDLGGNAGHKNNAGGPPTGSAPDMHRPEGRPDDPQQQPN